MRFPPFFYAHKNFLGSFHALLAKKLWFLWNGNSSPGTRHFWHSHSLTSEPDQELDPNGSDGVDSDGKGLTCWVVGVDEARLLLFEAQTAGRQRFNQGFVGILE